MENVIQQASVWQTEGRRLAQWVNRPLPWLLVFVFGLAARFRQYLGNPSYWYDEAALTVRIYDLSFLELIGPLPGRTITPPFFLWLLRGCYLAFGPQEWAMRLPAFVGGVVGLVLMIPLARRWLGSPGWLWALGFCALSTHCVLHAVEVRPYATDFLLTVTILLAAHVYLKALSLHERWWGGSGLLLAAALAPWLSFTSIFVLCAVSVALLLDWLHQKTPERVVYWCALNGLLGLTSFLVWFIQARHLYYPGLKEEWTIVWDGFPLNYSPGTLVCWTGRALVGAAHYATTGLGIPLLLLGLTGTVIRWRRSKEEAVLLAGPVVITYLAGLVGKYPFADRTIFFLAPCIWLLAVEGVLCLTRLSWPAVALLASVLVLGLLTPGFVKTTKLCVWVQPKMEYREALVFVQEHRTRDEAVWNWCPDLNTVYVEHVFCWQRANRNKDPHDAAEAALIARSCPLWVIVPDCSVDDMIRPLRSLPVHETLRQQFQGVTVLRYDWPH